MRILVLQHPQEPDRDLGTAKVLAERFPGTTVKVGLSWANLKKALGDDSVDHTRWAVLYLGSWRGKRGDPVLVALGKDSTPVPDQHRALDNIEGVVLLDGSWSQAKTLWWRNAWLLKLRRLALCPPRPSRYGKLRREPRRECLSTIEAAGYVLTGLGQPASVQESLDAAFTEHLQRFGPGPKAPKTDDVEV